MGTSLTSSPLTYRIVRILVNGKVRFLIQKHTSLVPSLSLSIYESYLSEKHSSHNSVYSALNKCLYLWTWADLMNIDLDYLLLHGETLETKQVRLFSVWLKQRISKSSGKRIDVTVINSTLVHVSSAIRWFAEQFATFKCSPIEREMKIAIYLNLIKRRFSDQRIKERKKKCADDLTEDEIKKIECFLRPENRIKEHPKMSPAKALRDYLIWRLVIEFGLREGELLALRLEDCPVRGQNFIKIVRIEERGSEYVDPRGTYAPRVKTLSRELGFILKNSPIPRLITEYTTKHRRRKVEKHGRKVYQPILDSPAFLILSHHHDKGSPLSLSSLLDVADEIRVGTGIDHFHFHLGRHSFFNRAYSSIIGLKETDNEMYKDRLRDLIYWGGWENENSLQLYINRARNDRAKMTLCFYQNESTEWNALN